MDMAIAQTNGTAIAFFLLFVLATLAVTWWAARRTRSTADYLAAGHRIGPWQNGLALAGDFLSAAGVLGVGGLIALAGFDGILFCMGATVGFTMLLLLLAEPLRNLGSYTFNDVLTVRLGSDTVRVTASVMSILLVLMYLTLQMVGAGTLVHLLFGLPYATAVEITGAIMMVYVLFGGMIATTFVQIIKTSLMLVAFVILVALTAQAYGFHLGELFASVGNRPGPSMVAPGRVFADPIDALSLGLTMPIGVASLPHVLIRFYTVPDAGAARRSVLYATGIIAVVQLGLILVGYAAMQLIGTDAIRAADRGGNLALPLLALHLGGGPLLGFVAAVSFGDDPGCRVGRGDHRSGDHVARHLGRTAAQGGSTARTAAGGTRDHSCVGDRRRAARPGIAGAEPCRSRRVVHRHRREHRVSRLDAGDFLVPPDHRWRRAVDGQRRGMQYRAGVPVPASTSRSAAPCHGRRWPAQSRHHQLPARLRGGHRGVTGGVARAHGTTVRRITA